MASTYSQRLRIELIGAGDQVGTWGTTTNSNFGTIVDSAIAGYTAVSVTTANQALTALNGAADQSRMAIVSLTTTTTANFNVYAPPASKLYVIRNASGYTATLYNSTVIGNTTAAGTGVAIPAGKTMTVWSDGTNFATQNNHIIGTVTGDVTGNASTVTNGVYTVGAQTIAGVKSFTSQIDAQAGVLGDLTGNVTGNADTATAATTAATWTTARTLTVGSTGKSVNGSANVSWSLAEIGAAATSHTHAASDITSGTMATARLASGTASSSTFLRGDSTWQAVPSVGEGQTWQNVSGSRALGTTYTNTTGRAIQVAASVYYSGTDAAAVVSGVQILRSYTVSCCGVPQLSVFPLTFIVPPGATYSVTGSSLVLWTELR